MCLGSVDRHDLVAPTLAAHGLRRCFLLRCDDAARKHNNVVCRDPAPLLPFPAFVSWMEGEEKYVCIRGSRA